MDDENVVIWVAFGDQPWEVLHPELASRVLKILKRDNPGAFGRALQRAMGTGRKVRADGVVTAPETRPDGGESDAIPGDSSPEVGAGSAAFRRADMPVLRGPGVPNGRAE